ncbi:MAG: HD domain-containing protein [Candidatus Aenigmarchaeota archaeon]|nr:HD domain-containing protein [Candidatus Aenigmarchaeota archaeon]
MMPMRDEDFVEKAEEFMIDCFESSNLPKVIAEGMIRHLLQTREYLLEITKGTNRDTTALEIAALLHGIERAFRKGEGYKNLVGKKHEDRSAAIAKDFLEKKKAPKALIKKVVSLIEKHETAPTKESKILREADNLSFLENTLPIWFEARLWMGENKKEIIESCKKIVEEKFRQIKSKKGKEIARKFYKKWMNWLKQKEENL